MLLVQWQSNIVERISFAVDSMSETVLISLDPALIIRVKRVIGAEERICQ